MEVEIRGVYEKILGIELGSTRIKSVLIDESATVIVQGSYEWENTFVDGLWSYSLESVEKGFQTSYADLVENYKTKFGEELTKIGVIGISAMMHGYLPLIKRMISSSLSERGEIPIQRQRQRSLADLFRESMA